MNNLFLMLIHDFNRTVEVAVNKLNRKNELIPNFFLEHRAGYLNNAKTETYKFHGRGCAVKLSNGILVDFNFGENGRCDGFECWSLESFISSNEIIRLQYSIYNDYQKIETMIEDFVKSGFIIRDNDWNIFYLSDDFDNPNPVRWLSNPHSVTSESPEGT